MSTGILNDKKITYIYTGKDEVKLELMYDIRSVEELGVEVKKMCVVHILMNEDSVEAEAHYVDGKANIRRIDFFDRENTLLGPTICIGSDIAHMFKLRNKEMKVAYIAAYPNKDRFLIRTTYTDKNVQDI